MPSNVYVCLSCFKGFKTRGELKIHKCGEVIPEPKVEKEMKDIPDKQESIQASSQGEETDFDRKKAINDLKDHGIISDKRSVTKKSDAELKEMLEDIEA